MSFEDYPILIAKLIQSKKQAEELKNTKTKSTPPVVSPSVSQPVEPKKRVVSSLKGKFKSAGGISIKHGVYKASSQEESQGEDTDNFINKPASQFTQDQLVASWRSFAKKCSDEGKNIFSSILLRFDPELKDNFVVVFGIEHNSALMEFDTQKQALLNYIRKVLNNYHLTITVEMRAPKSEKVVYTNRDRYNRLSEKNDALKELVRKLDLEVDF